MNPPQKKKKESTSSYFQGTIPFPLPRPPETKDELAVRLAAGRGEASVLRLDLREGGGGRAHPYEGPPLGHRIRISGFGHGSLQKRRNPVG